jgi:putative ABC transport system ATP-binding protein
MFRNLDPADEFFQGFNLIRSDELAAYELLIRKSGSSSIDALDDAERGQLVQLALKLVATRHTLGVIDDTLRQGVLRARALFRHQLPADLLAAVVFFDEGAVNPAGNLYDNLLYGKTLSARTETQSGVAALVRKTVETAGLLPFVLRLGLEFDVGLDGAFLSVSQRQRVALARCLIKRPDVLVLNDAFAAIELHRQMPIITAVRDHMRGRSLLLIEGSEINATGMEHVFDVTNGRMQHRETAQGQPEAGMDQHVEAIDLGGTAAILSKVPLFAGMDRARLKLLAFTSERVSCAIGDVVFRQADAGDKAYVVLDGQVEVIVESQAGDTVVATIGRHQIFGEMALLASRPRTTTIRAGSPTQLLALRQDVFVDWPTRSRASNRNRFRCVELTVDLHGGRYSR